MNIEKDVDRLSQKKALEYLLSDNKTTDMVTVYFSDYKRDSHSYGIYCALIPENKKDEALDSYAWDLTHGCGLPSTSVFHENNEKKAEYLRFGSDSGIEPLVIDRDFHGIKDNYSEISEEFRLFHNLYYDKKSNSYLKFSDSGNETVIIEMKEDLIRIRTKELKQYLAIKRMYLSIQFDYREHSAVKLDSLNIPIHHKNGKNECSIWSLDYGDFGGVGANQSFSRLLGKKLISPFPIEKCGLYGFDEVDNNKYCDFIIDTSELGDEIHFSSNPDSLNNSFNSNPTFPHYLTPIYFKKEVLDKYYRQPSKYSVDDSMLSCASLWGLQIDNHHDDKVCVWLGDLGRDLPYEEQLYWRSFNICPTGGVSETYYKRQILAEFTDSQRPEHLFKTKYNELQDLSQKKLGYQLFLPLNIDDIHYYESLRIPSTNEQCNFDELVLGLTKVLIDSLNEKQLNKYITNEKNNEIKGSISKLEVAFNITGCADYETHINFLRKLQNLRSASSAHRKGSNYNKIATEFDIKNKPLKLVFEEILISAINLIDYLIDMVKSERLATS